MTDTATHQGRNVKMSMTGKDQRNTRNIYRRLVCIMLLTTICEARSFPPFESTKISLHRRRLMRRGTRVIFNNKSNTKSYIPEGCIGEVIYRVGTSDKQINVGKSLVQWDIPYRVEIDTELFAKKLDAFGMFGQMKLQVRKDQDVTNEVECQDKHTDAKRSWYKPEHITIEIKDDLVLDTNLTVITAISRSSSIVSNKSSDTSSTATSGTATSGTPNGDGAIPHMPNFCFTEGQAAKRAAGLDPHNSTTAAYLRCKRQFRNLTGDQQKAARRKFREAMAENIAAETAAQLAKLLKEQEDEEADEE